MNRQVCGRKNFMVDTIMNGQPGKLFENGRDVVNFLTLYVYIREGTYLLESVKVKIHQGL